MNAFPLAPFLYALMAEGVSVSFNDYDRINTVLSTGDKWSLKRLRGVLIALLAHNKEEAERIRRRFDAFFVTPDNDELSSEQVSEFLEALRKAVKEEAPISGPQPVDDPHGSAPVSAPIYIPPVKPLWKRPLVWCVIFGVLLSGIVIFWNFKGGRTGSTQNKNGTQTVLSSPTPEDTPVRPDASPRPIVNTVGRLPQYSSYGGELRLDTIGSIEPAPSRHRWTDFLATIIAFVLLVLLWFGISALVSKALREPPPRFNPNSPRLFSFTALGEPAKPQLDGPTLDRLADSINYYLSIRPSKRLDIGRTIKETGRNAGMPALCFYRQRQVRRVCIFEDSLAEPLIWNSVTRELLDGLSKRGVDVLYGSFAGSLDKFILSDGRTYWLDDLDNERRDSLFLFFSDGKHLGSRRDAFALERLARLPLVAWFDFRDRKFWDETALLIKTYGIPLYQANAKGLMRAFDRFLMESATDRDDTATVPHWRGFPPYTDGQLAVYIEHVLGDALVWAQACAMTQPLSLRMAHTLRRKFQPHLPSERVERLFRLPGTTWQGSCLRFSREVLAALRGGFTARLSAKEQENILQFIQDQIRAHEPPKSEQSLRRLVWEWTLRRVQLESSPDEVLPILSQLSQTPLGTEIKWDLSHLVFADQPQTGSGDLAMVPLRARPVTPKGVAYLKEFSPHVVMSDSLGKKFAFNWKRVQFILKRVWMYVSLDIVSWWRELRAVRTATAQQGNFVTEEETIFAEPAELTLRRLFVGEIKTSCVTFRTTSKLGLAGRLVSDNEWLKVTPSYCDQTENEKAVTVVIDAHTLNPGKHAGNITFIPANNSGPIDVPVELEVYRSWKGVILHWWQTHRPKYPLRAGALSLLVLAVLVLITFKVLPANWPNRIFNRPPRLVALKPLTNEDLPVTMIALEAVTDDAESDGIQYEWTSNWGRVIGNWQKPILVAGNSSRPQSVKLTLTLHDSRGGYDSYSVPLLFEKGNRRSFVYYDDYESNLYYEYPDPRLLLDGLKSPDSRERWIAANSLAYVSIEHAEVIPALTKSVNDSDPNVASTAMASLGYFRSQDLEPAINAIISRLQNDQSIEIRAAAAAALAGFSGYHDLTVPALLNALQDQSDAVCTAAADSLGKIGRDAKKGLLERLKSPTFNLRVRRFVATALAGEGINRSKDINEIVPVLLEVLNNRDNDIELRRRAAYSLAQLRSMDEEKLGVVIANLKDKSAPVRGAVASILWSIAGQSKFSELVVPALLDAIKDNNAEVRRNAIGAIANIRPRPENTEPLLLERLKDSDAEVRRYAVGALTADPTDLKLVSQLLTILKDRRAQRTGAAEVVGNLNLTQVDAGTITEAVEALKAALSDSDVELRHASAYALAKLAWRDNNAIEALSGFFTDSDPYLRDAAISAVWEINGRRTAPDVTPNATPKNDFTSQLRSALTDKSDFVREHAVTALGLLSNNAESNNDSSETVSFLTNLALTDGNTTVADVALETLYRRSDFCSLAPELLKSQFSRIRAKTLAGLGIKDCFQQIPKLRDQVFELISNDNNRVASAAVAAVYEYSYYGLRRRGYYSFSYPEDSEYVDPYVAEFQQWLLQRTKELLTNQSFKVRILGLALISENSSDEVILPVLNVLRNDKDPRVRCNAVSALLKMKGEAALPYISELRDPDPRIRYAVQLGRIGLKRRSYYQSYYDRPYYQSYYDPSYYQSDYTRPSLSEADHQILIDIYKHGDFSSSSRARSLLSYFDYYPWNDPQLAEDYVDPEDGID